jgi:hypothetical protein
MAQNPNIDDATRARAMKFVADKSASAPAKSRVVSKKELEDSGLSLRDFLNKERGLTRKAPEGTKFGAEVSRPTGLDIERMKFDEMGQKGLDERGNPIRDDSANVSRNQYRESGKAMVDKQDEETRMAKAMAANKPRRNPSQSESAMKRGGTVKKYAAGGSVSSASKRADGIAQRGKTRGKMC